MLVIRVLSVTVSQQRVPGAKNGTSLPDEEKSYSGMMRPEMSQLMNNALFMNHQSV